MRSLRYSLLSMKRLLTYSLILLVLACTSGKKAFERGDYTTAVYQSIERLRQKPDHSKSQEALRLAYPLAVEYLESLATSTIASDAPFKWKTAMGYYNQINALHDQVKTSPAALRIIKTPVSKFTEIADLRKKAADESYEAGIQAMMRNTRSDAIRAFYLFQETNSFEPGYKDVVELQYQAEYNATIRIQYKEISYRNREDWVAVEPIVNNLRLPFTKFYTAEQAENEKAPIHHTMLIEVLGYSEVNPNISRSERNFIDSVQVDRTVAGKKVKVYEKITGRATTFEKKALSRGLVQITIKETGSEKQLLVNEFVGNGNWTGLWSRCFGDQRALPENVRNACGRSEPQPDAESMLRMARQDVQRQIERSLTQFYRI